MIFKQYKVGELSSNNYLLIDDVSKEAVLIDCTGNFEGIKKDLDENCAKLKYILLTHGHFDHVLGCKKFQDELKPEILIHKNDKILLDNLQVQCNYFGLQAGDSFEVKFLDENTKLKFGDYDIKIIETKGHTKGGVSYLIDNMLFSGDTLFFEEVGRCDLAGGNFEELADSISKKLYKLNPKTPVYPGHGKPTTIGHEMEFNYYVNKNSME